LVVAGTYLVGTDIKPGIYMGVAAEGDSCYWERLKGVSGTFDDIIANDNSAGQYYVEVKSSDFAFQTDCDMTLLDSPLVPSIEFPMTKIGPGTYILGIDIQAGMYKGKTDEGDTCYWERLSGVSGTSDDIIANDNAEGQYYVKVAPSDFALLTECELELVEK
jgi:hypothetical protein